jgi:hypothetical protein
LAGKIQFTYDMKWGADTLGIFPQNYYYFDEVARGGWGANPGPLDLIYFLIFTTLPLSHSGFQNLYLPFYRLLDFRFLRQLVARH